MASSEITIELGDFVKIISPTKAMYHLKTFLVEYIDDDIIEVIDVANGDKFQLDLYDDGRIIDEQILAIHLLSRSPEPGYARIHKLLPGLWINIEFEEEVGMTIIGQIVDLEEDRIKVLPKNDTKTPLYIDFAYQGMPKNIPIKKIAPIESPSVQDSLTIISTMEEDIEASAQASQATQATQATQVAPILTEPKESLISTISSAITNALTPETIVINDKPAVTFGKYNTVFSTEHPEESDLIIDVREDESYDGDHEIPALEIMDDAGQPLGDNDFDTLDGGIQSIGAGDYEEL